MLTRRQTAFLILATPQIQILFLIWKNELITSHLLLTFYLTHMRQPISKLQQVKDIQVC